MSTFLKLVPRRVTARSRLSLLKISGDLHQQPCLKQQIRALTSPNETPCRKLAPMQCLAAQQIQTSVKTYDRSIHTSNEPNALPNARASPAEYSSARVTIPIDGESADFSALLLRDSCQCPACVHGSTKQRLFSTVDIPSDIDAKSVTSATTSDSVIIKWAKDVPGFNESHETMLSLDALRSFRDVGSMHTPSQTGLGCPVLWGAADSDPLDITFKSYLQDDATVYQVMKQLRLHGLVFITEIPHLEDALVKIATRIGPMKDTFYGRTWDVRTVPNAINAAYTSADLGFHTDLLYFTTPAHIQLLHCIQSSSSGGASVFTDAFKSANDLFENDEAAFNTLASITVNYHYSHPNDNLYYTTKTVFELRPLKIGDATYATVREYLSAWKQKQAEVDTLPDIDVADCLEKINWGPPFLAPFSLQEQSGQPSYGSLTSRVTLNQKVDAWHAAARKFNALLQRSEALHERLMKPGECVLFDNTRVLHSRKAFNIGDAGKARWLKGGYIDKDPFLSKLKVLGGKYDS